MSAFELFALFFGLLYLGFVAYHKRIGWIFGCLSSGIYTLICWRQALFIQALLQFSYVILGIIGYLKCKKNTKLFIKRTSIKENIIYVSTGVFLSLCIGKWMSTTIQQLPYLDTTIAIFSIIATLLATKSILENWLYWIFGNSLAIILFASQTMYITSVLYIIYLCGSIFGFYNWKKMERLQSQIKQVQ